MAQGQVNKVDGTKSPTQVAVWYPGPLVRHVAWRCHGGKAHLCDSPVLAPSGAVPVEHILIAASIGLQ